jgi:pyridoxal phosphate enzyme (YggS family)
LAENLSAVRQRIARAAERNGRSPHDVTLVAVTKYVDSATARALVAAGCSELGESRPQELWQKAEACAGLDVHWHLIGHLQRNKVSRTLPLVSMVHSVDSLRLLQELDRESARLGRRLPILLEFNISGDASKHGFSPADAATALGEALQCASVEVRGLMGMASREGDLDSARIEFRGLRQLRDQLNLDVAHDSPIRDLSMGMSGDFEVAIEEGATIVRIGSILFEGIDA